MHRAPVALVFNFVNVPVSDNYEMSPFPILLPWDCDDSDSEEEHQQAQLLVGLLECWQQTKDVYGPVNISWDTLYQYRCWDYFVTFIILMRPSQDNDLPCKCWDLFDIIYIYLPNHFIVPKQWMFKCLKTVNLLFKLNYILRNQILINLMVPKSNLSERIYLN